MSAIEDRKEALELLALSTYESVMSDSKADPKERLAAADSVMRLYGHFQQPKLAGPANGKFAMVAFWEGAKKAVAGMDVVQDLLEREPT